MVLPTISGKMVERRDQVLMTFLSLVLFCSSTFLSRWPSMNGPLEVDLAIEVLLPPLHDHGLRALVAARLVTLGGFAPRGHGMAAARGAAFAAAVRVVDRVHGDTSVVGLLAQPALASGLAVLHILVLGVSDLADGGLAEHVH